MVVFAFFFFQIFEFSNLGFSERERKRESEVACAANDKYGLLVIRWWLFICFLFSFFFLFEVLCVFVFSIYLIFIFTFFLRTRGEVGGIVEKGDALIF